MKILDLRWPSKGQVIHLEPDDYEVVLPEGDSEAWLNRGLRVFGAHESITRLFLEGQTLKVHGRDADRRISRWAFRDLTFIDGRFDFKYATLGEFVGCTFQNTPVKMTSSWDCDFDKCEFIRWSPNDYALELCDALTDHENTNNMWFNNCRFENGAWHAVKLGMRATKNRFMGCKWHGQLPPLIGMDHVHMFGAYDNWFMGCNVTNAGGSGFLLRDGCRDNSWTGSHIGNSRAWGIDGAKGNNIEAIIWATVRGRNALGDVHE